MSGGPLKTYRDWVVQAQASDAEMRNDAFDQLIRDFQGMVYSVAFSRLSDRQLAEDAAQEAFLAAYRSIMQLKDVGAFPAWLKRIAQGKADAIRRRQGVNAASIDEQGNLASADASPEAQIEAAELRQRVRLAVAALPERERDLTHDFYFRGDTQREISQRRDIPLATVKKRLQYAREHLRGLITGFHEYFDQAMYEEPRQELQPVYINRRAPRPIHLDD